MSFDVIPAIDIRGGKCVRLLQGDFAAETIYNDTPATVAKEWEQQGAQWIHVVDLDGAREGKSSNYEAVQSIRKAVSCHLQVGGGIRDLDTITRLLSLGVNCVVLGTAAIEHPNLLMEAVEKHGECIVAAIDVRDGEVAVRGWQTTKKVTPEALAKRLAFIGMQRIIYTDIARDGMLSEPNIEATAKLAKHASLPVIASGGVASLEHVCALAYREMDGITGCIIGKALYERRFTLREALDHAMNIVSDSIAR